MLLRPSAEDGFSLLEILVAIALLSAAGAATLSAINSSLEAVRVADRTLREVALARSLTTSFGTKRSLDPGVYSGAADDLRWRARITTFAQATYDARFKPDGRFRWVYLRVSAGDPRIAPIDIVTAKLVPAAP
jgi:prepilin-type N-terminal cleavage/methylation domain-containing protein